MGIGRDDPVRGLAGWHAAGSPCYRRRALSAGNEREPRPGRPEDLRIVRSGDRLAALPPAGSPLSGPSNPGKAPPLALEKILCPVHGIEGGGGPEHRADFSGREGAVCFLHLRVMHVAAPNDPVHGLECDRALPAIHVEPIALHDRLALHPHQYLGKPVTGTVPAPDGRMRGNREDKVVAALWAT